MPEHALLTIDSDAGQKQLALEPGSYLIGRSDSCDLVVSSIYLRREHARLTIHPDGFEVEEVGVQSDSRQFTYPNETDLGVLSLNLEWRTEGSTASDHTNYATVRELARGGMGRVIDARDLKLDRNVAMKVLLQQDATEADRRRFYQEARVLGQLEHPNIVPVHDLGSDENGQPFYTMKLVQGSTLNEILGQLREGNPDALEKYPLNHLLTIFQKICDAVAFAHSRGIIHRDLKPHNIMVGEFGEVLVMDWGLAKILTDGHGNGHRTTGPSEGHSSRENGPTGTVKLPDEQAPVDAAANTLTDDDVTLAPGFVHRTKGSPVKFRKHSAGSNSANAAQLTVEGAVMGTPHYMSPEQAQGMITDLDVRSDIFSLGGILYAILTLRPPVNGETVEEVLERVRSGSIESPVDFNTGIGSSVVRPKRDSTGDAGPLIQLRHCPDNKIPRALSAVAMKALSRQPEDRYQEVPHLAADIAAHQEGFATSAEEAGTVTQIRLLIRRHKTIAAAASLIVLLTLGFLVQVMDSERKATRNAIRATENEKIAKRNERSAATNAALARLEADRASAAQRVALQEKEATRKALAKAQIALAEAAFRAHDSIAMRAALQKVPEDLQDANHSYLAVRADDSLATLRTRVDGGIRGSAADPTRPGVFAVVGRDHRVLFLNARTGRHLSSFPTRFTNVTVQYVLSFSPDGSLLALGNREATHIQIFATKDGRPLARWETPPPEAIEFGPEGKRLLVVPTTNPTRDRTGDRGKSWLRMHEVQTGNEIWSREFESRRLRGCFVGGGERVLTTFGYGNRPVLLDAKDGREIRNLPGLPDYQLALAASPDGLFMFVGNEQGRLRKIRLEDGEVMLDLRVSESRIRSIVITPDSKRFVTLAAEQDQSTVQVKVWDLASGAPLATLMGVERPAFEMCLHPISLELMVAGSINSKSWDLYQQPPTWTFEAAASRPAAEFWGADDWLVFAADGPCLAARHLQAQGIGLIVASGLNAGHLDVSQNGKRAITGSGSGPLTLIEREGGRLNELASFKLASKAYLLRLDSSGTRVWTGPDILDAMTGSKRATVQGFKGDPGDWVGTNHLVIAGHQDTVNWLWLVDATTGKALLGRNTGHSRILCVVGAPDGRTVAEAGQDRHVRIRQRDSLEIVSEFRAHDAPVFTVAFHPTRPILASGSADLSVRLWDLETGTMLEELRGPTAIPKSLVFSPGGGRLACVSLDHQLRVWEPKCLQKNMEEPVSQASGNIDAGADDWIDLLAIGDPREAKQGGHGWQLVDGTLRSPDRLNGVVALPGDFVNASYQLRIAFRRLKPREFLGIFLPVGTRQTGFVIDGYPNNGFRSGLHLLDGNTAAYDPQAITGQQIKDDKTHQLEIVVRNNGLTSRIEIQLDSQLFYRWVGPTSSLDMSPRIKGVAPGQIGLGSHYAEWVITSARARRL